jgi:hypothetical protein
MNLFKNIFFVTFYLTVLVSCRNKDNNSTVSNPQIIYINVSNWDKYQSIPDTIISKISFIALETNDSCLVGGIRKLTLIKDRFYILDKGINKKIFIFDIKGNFIKSIGNYGKGPGEFISLTDFLIDEKKGQLFALDAERRKVLVFNLINGSFAYDFKINFLATEFEKIDEDLLVFFVKSPISNSKKEYAIAILNLQDKSYKLFLEKDEYYTPLNGPYSIFQSKNTCFAPYLKDIVYLIKPNGLEPYIQFDFGQYSIPSEKIRNTDKNPKKIVQLLESNGNFTYGIENIYENDDFITFSLKIKNTASIAVYSKTTTNCFYGNRYEPGLNILRFINNISVHGDQFLSTIDSYYFKKCEKEILEKGSQNLKEEYLKTIKFISDISNPVIIFIEYKTF